MFRTKVFVFDGVLKNKFGSSSNFSIVFFITVKTEKVSSPGENSPTQQHSSSWHRLVR